MWAWFLKFTADNIHMNSLFLPFFSLDLSWFLYLRGWNKKKIIEAVVSSNWMCILKTNKIEWRYFHARVWKGTVDFLKEGSGAQSRKNVNFDVSLLSKMSIAGYFLPF